MTNSAWKDFMLPHGNEDLLYELFHENSKIGRHSPNPSLNDVIKHMNQLHQSLPYEGYSRIDLLRPVASPDVSLFHVMQERSSVRTFLPSTIPLQDLSTLLHYGYGITRASDETGTPRGLRMVPSGGALYPLEIYLHTAKLENADGGLYHYNPEQNCLRFLGVKDVEDFSTAMVQPDIGNK